MLALVVRVEPGCGEMLRVEVGSGTAGIKFFSLRLKKDMMDSLGVDLFERETEGGTED